MLDARVLAVAAFWLLLRPTGGIEHPPIPDCEGKKIGILDLSDLSAIGNFPKCQLDQARPFAAHIEVFETPKTAAVWHLGS